MGTRHSEYREDPLGWYVEHPDVSIALFDKLDELGLSLDVLHDPSCGQGNIIDVALARGIRATGADIVDRASGRFAVRDFPQDTRTYRNIVNNPPYKRRAGPPYGLPAQAIARGSSCMRKATVLAVKHRFAFP